MLYVGCHLSASAGNYAMVETARSIGANTFAFFTRNPRGSKAKAEDPADCARAAAALQAENFGKLVAHGAYTMNLCTAQKDARDFAEKLSNCRDNPLKVLTDDCHYHTVAAPSEKLLDLIELELREKGYLL